MSKPCTRSSTAHRAGALLSVVSLVAALAGCGADAGADADAAPSPRPTASASPVFEAGVVPPAPYTEVTIDAASLTSGSRTSGAGTLTDSQGHTYDASWWGSATAMVPDTSQAPPGSADIPVDVRAGAMLNNTTAGRVAPGDLLGRARLLELYAADRPVCWLGSAEMVTIGGTAYCIFVTVVVDDGTGVANGIAIAGPLSPGFQTEAGNGTTRWLRVAQDQVAGVLADVAMGPDAWVLAVLTPELGVHEGVAKPTGSCTISSTATTPELSVVWASSALPRCATPLLGAPDPVVDTAAAAASLQSYLAGDRDHSVCPMLHPDNRIGVVTHGVDTTDPEVTMPVVSDQDNLVVCDSGALPGGISVSAAWDWQVVYMFEFGTDPQKLANMLSERGGTDPSISGPLTMYGGEAIAYTYRWGTRVQWNDGTLALSGIVPEYPDDTAEVKLRRSLSWLAMNLPAMVSNLSDKS